MFKNQFEVIWLNYLVFGFLTINLILPFNEIVIRTAQTIIVGNILDFVQLISERKH